MRGANDWISGPSTACRIGPGTTGSSLKPASHREDPSRRKDSRNSERTLTASLPYFLKSRRKEKAPSPAPLPHFRRTSSSFLVLVRSTPYLPYPGCLRSLLSSDLDSGESSLRVLMASLRCPSPHLETQTSPKGP